jgi:hypothetical protein
MNVRQRSALSMSASLVSLVLLVGCSSSGQPAAPSPAKPAPPATVSAAVAASPLPTSTTSPQPSQPAATASRSPSPTPARAVFTPTPTPSAASGAIHCSGPDAKRAHAALSDLFTAVGTNVDEIGTAPNTQALSDLQSAVDTVTSQKDIPACALPAQKALARYVQDVYNGLALVQANAPFDRVRANIGTVQADLATFSDDLSQLAIQQIGY